MLHYVHQAVTNCVCLLFLAEQVVYTEFRDLFHWKQLPAALYKSVESEPKQ